MTDELAKTLALETLRGDHDSFLVFKDRIEELGDRRLTSKRTKKGEVQDISWIDKVGVVAEYAGSYQRWKGGVPEIRLDDVQFNLYAGTGGAKKGDMGNYYSQDSIHFGGVDRRHAVAPFHEYTIEWLFDTRWILYRGGPLRIDTARQDLIMNFSGEIIREDPAAWKELVSLVDNHEPEIRRMVKYRADVLTGTGFTA